MSCCPPTVLCSFDNSCIPSPVLRTPASIYTFFSLPHPLLSAITFSNLLWFITWPIQMLHFFAVVYTKTTKKINSLKNLFVFIYIINYDSRCTCTSSICLKFFFPREYSMGLNKWTSNDVTSGEYGGVASLFFRGFILLHAVWHYHVEISDDRCETHIPFAMLCYCYQISQNYD